MYDYRAELSLRPSLRTDRTLRNSRNIEASVVSIFLFSLILSVIFPSKVEPYFVSVSLLGIL